ncbi:MAG: hypothetical protein WA821_05010 [Anaerolineales bacterium]
MKSFHQFAKMFALAVILLAFLGLFGLAMPPAALAQAAATSTHLPPPPGAQIPTGGNWEQISSQDFEYAFPSAGWSMTDTSGDGYERFWKDNSYRPYSGSWAAWPAAGGADRLNPSTQNYANNMETRMIYGPFDLSDANGADTDFALWVDTEPFNDYVSFEISCDNQNFTELARWSGSASWSVQDIYYNDYHCPLTWVAWRFHSDYSVTSGGPWVDNIRIWKYVLDATLTPTRTLSPTITRTRTKTLTPTITRTRTKTPTRTLSPTITKTRTKTNTPTQTKTPTITKTPTRTKTRTPLPTRTRTKTPTRTRTRTPSRTPTICPLSACTRTPTRTPTRTLTRTITRTPTITPSPSPTSDLPPATFFDENQLSDFTHPITGVSARTIYTHYRLLWNWDEIDPRYWWWDIFGKTADGSSFDADGFSFWDYIALYMNHEAEYKNTAFANDMAEAGVRFWYTRVNAKPPLATPGVYGFVDWWASFSQSVSVEAKSMSLIAGPQTSRDNYRAFIAAAENFKNPPTDWQDGQRQDRPYGWGNSSAYAEHSKNSKVEEMLAANQDKYPIIFRYISGRDPMYVPSGCAVINWVDNSDDNPGTAWNPNVCDFLLPTPTPASQQEITNMQKNKTSLGALTTLCAIFMIGCTSPSTPTDFVTPSVQVISPTATPTAAPAATATPESALPWCIDRVEMSPSLGAMPDGVVVVQGQGSRTITLLDLQTGGRQSLDGKASFIMAVSPDQRQLAYTSFLKGPLQIVDSSGAPVANQPLPQGWVGVVRWIDMDTLLMEKFAEEGDYYRNASSIVYHFKTGEQQELPPNYPGMDLATIFQWGNYSYTRTVYDPSLSRVIYPGLVLWDIQNNRQIIELHQGLDRISSSAPQWSQDGSFFIAAVPPQAEVLGTLYKNVTDSLPYKGGYELMRVTRDGAIQRLTTLTTQFNAGEEAFSLSPDEKRIAFWLVPDYGVDSASRTPKSLAILDMESGEITDLGIPGGESSVAPIWSPDGKYLVVSRFTADETVDKSLLPDVLLVDLEHKQAIRIAEKSVANGWMVK